MIFYFFVFLIIAFVLSVCVFPVETESLRAEPSPVMSYDESVRLVREQIDNVPAHVAEYGKPILMTHGRQVGRSVVMYHGYTNCPRQYEQLAKIFFDRGYNVYVPRVPHHGIKDLFTEEIAKLTIAELMEVCDSSVDIARGLGQKVTVLGLSMGGVMTAWNAQFRDDVELAVVIVPNFGWYFLPGVVKPLVNLACMLPNMFLWWDLFKKEKRDCPYSMYYKFSSRGMGYILRLGLSVMRAAKKKAPLCKNILVMTTDFDTAVDEPNIKNVIKRWRNAGASVDWYRFPKDLKIEHDVIDPFHPYAKVDFVYGKILEGIERIRGSGV